MKKIIPIFLACFLIFSCEPDDNNNDVINNGFDRQALLVNWADNIIEPAYNDFYNNLEILNNSILEFVAEPNEIQLNIVSDNWLDAYKKWQYLEMFDIGLAEAINFKGKINIYPTDTDVILSNISVGNYDLNNNNNFDARGFPAMDYMIHGIADTQDAILSVYLNDTNFGQYLEALINNMLYNTNLIIENWQTYRFEFVESTGNTATSSINKVINDFIFYFEKGLRANKIGIPAGVFSNYPLPQNVEAYFNQNVSKELTLEALEATKCFFIGRHYNSFIEGVSMRDYLNYLPASLESGLSEEILSQFEEAKNQINALDDNFVNQIASNNSQMLDAYDAVQALVVYFKVDMLQSLSISVDYIDADGD